MRKPCAMSDISFSVVIPTFRRPKLLIRSLQSVLVQLEDTDEIIVVNDDRIADVSLDVSVIEHKDKIKIFTNKFDMATHSPTECTLCSYRAECCKLTRFSISSANAV